MAINVQDIVTEYGAYYIQGGQNEQRLKRLLLFGRETTKFATQIKTNDTVYRLAQSSITSLVQSFQKSFTPKGEVTFTPHPIPLFKMKVDMELYPDDIEDNWLGFLASNDLARKEWPLVRYILEKHVFDKIADDLELNEYYKGVFATPQAGTAGANGASMNGLKTILNEDGINRLTMSALNATTIYDQVEAAFEQVAEVYQKTQMAIGMSPKWARAFLKDKRTLGYYTIDGANKIDNSLDFAPAKVYGLPSMIGTDDIWITPQSNFLHLTKKGENASKVKIEESKRCLAIMTDWWEGLGFGLKEVVWTNVPAPTPES